MKITTQRILARLSKVSSFYLFKHERELKQNTKIVSFTFDDFPKTAISNGAAILDKYLKRGTFYISFSLCGENSPSGNIAEISDIINLKNRNHEIGCHTYSHLDCFDSKIKIIVDDYHRNKLMAKKNLGLTLFSFAYPGGNIKPSAKKVIAKEYETARVIENGINFSPIDLFALKSVPLYQRHGINNALAWLEMLKKRDGWLIFYTHDVSEQPSEYGCTKELLEELIIKCIDYNYEITTIYDAFQSALKPISIPQYIRQ